jgi:hypothetical protein
MIRLLTIVTAVVAFAVAAQAAWATPAKTGANVSELKIVKRVDAASTALQNAENVRSQAERRLETQRKDLARNWGG